MDPDETHSFLRNEWLLLLAHAEMRHDRTSENRPLHVGVGPAFLRVCSVEGSDAKLPQDAKKAQFLAVLELDWNHRHVDAKTGLAAKP